MGSMVMIKHLTIHGVMFDPSTIDAIDDTYSTLLRIPSKKQGL